MDRGRLRAVAEAMQRASTQKGIVYVPHIGASHGVIHVIDQVLLPVGM